MLSMVPLLLANNVQKFFIANNMLGFETIEQLTFRNKSKK